MDRRSRLGLRPTVAHMGFGASIVRWRYRQLARVANRRMTSADVDGRRFLIAPGVFHPVLHLSGQAVASMLDSDVVPAGGRVLDLGTGAGVLASCAARWAGSVVATDVSPAAVTCAQKNMVTLGLQAQVDVRLGDMFEPVAEDRFDLIITNPPYDTDQAATLAEAAFATPDFFDKLAASFGSMLKAGGTMAMALPSGHTEPIEVLRAAGHSCAHWRTAETAVAQMTLWRVTPATS